MLSDLAFLASMFTLCAIIADLNISSKHRRAVKGSHQRYVFASWHRISAWAVVGGFFFQGLFAVLNHSFITASIFLIVSAIDAIIEIRRKKDDDWFNGRGRKIKNGIKKAFTIKVRVPSLTPVYGSA